MFIHNEKHCKLLGFNWLGKSNKIYNIACINMQNVSRNVKIYICYML